MNESRKHRKAWKRVRPHALSIGSMTWAVCYDSHKLDALTINEGGQHYGLCQPGETVIYVRGTAPVDVQRDTLMHELLHALSDTYGVEWVKDEERMVSRLAPLLLTVLRDNPTLVEALTF